MNILVLNSGSSSIKFSIFGEPTENSPDPSLLTDGELTGIGQSKATLTLSTSHAIGVSAESPKDAIHAVLDAVCASGILIEAAGYRIVHPGPSLQGHQRITDEVLSALEAARTFAPLHDPAAVEVIRAGMKRFDQVPHFACFDTEFHRTMPEAAFTYPIPDTYRQAGVRRYGFHGLSYESIVRQLHDGPGVPARMVIAHLGSGCSVTALEDGRSIDTSMGLTPTGGVVMGTRPGDLDPGLIFFLLRSGKSVDEVERMLNHDAGIVALSHLPNDVKAVRKAAAAGDPDAALALKVFTRSVAKTIGGYTWLLGGLDALIFAGGIGENDPATRSDILDYTQKLGLLLDQTLNQSKIQGLRRISASDSKTQVFVVPAQEDLMIALHVARMAGQPS